MKNDMMRRFSSNPYLLDFVGAAWCRLVKAVPPLSAVVSAPEVAEARTLTETATAAEDEDGCADNDEYGEEEEEAEAEAEAEADEAEDEGEATVK